MCSSTECALVTLLIDSFRHIEGASTIFGTAMNYVALRLLGVEKDDSLAKKSRRFLHANGTYLLTQ
jgi:hypothetical protein